MYHKRDTVKDIRIFVTVKLLLLLLYYILYYCTKYMYTCLVTNIIIVNSKHYL